MKKNIEARLPKFPYSPLSKNAVLEAPAAQDNPVQPCSFPYLPSHLAEGGLQGEVKRSGELITPLSCVEPLHDSPDHGRKIKMNDVPSTFDMELQSTAGATLCRGFQFHRRLSLEGNLSAKPQNSGDAVKEPSQALRQGRIESLLHYPVHCFIEELLWN